MLWSSTFALTSTSLPHKVPAVRVLTQPEDRGRLLFVVNEAYGLLSHRLAIATAAQRAGWEVHVAAPSDHVWAPPDFSERQLEERGFSFHAVPLSRRGRNPIADLRTLVALLRLYRRLRPRLVHHVTLKPSVYGGIAARLTRVPAAIFAITGLGHVFVARGVTAGLLRAPVSPHLFAWNAGVVQVGSRSQRQADESKVAPRESRKFIPIAVGAPPIRLHIRMGASSRLRPGSWNACERHEGCAGLLCRCLRTSGYERL